MVTLADSRSIPQASPLRTVAAVLTPEGWAFRLVTLLAVGSALALVHQLRLMAPVPLSLVLGLLLAAWLCTDLVYYFWPHPLRFWQVHCRFAIEAAGVTAVMYVGGWGPALMIGYIYLAADNMRSIGARALLPSMFWAAVCTLIAQTAIAAGWAPTIIPLPLAHGLALFGLLGSCLGIYLVGSAFGQSERSQAALRRVAYDDPVTGLPNRPFFVECLTSAIADARAAQNRLAVLLFGLDDFKLVNDSLGLSVGDGLLRAVGALLQRHLQADDLLAHFGSDEFIVLIRDVAGPKVASERAERLLNLLRQPFVMDGGPRFLSASVGVALGGAGDGEITADGLLQAADAALHQAKLAGGSRVTVFAPDMTASARARLDIETDLRQAVRHDQLRVYYQPYVDLQTGRILGLEALLRWEHPQHGLMLPDQFIHIAEQTGSIVSLGRWVLREACRQARLLEAYSPDRASLTVSVNLSVKELLQPDLAQNVSEIIREAGIDAERINLEITESAVMQDAEFGIATLQALRGAGVRLAIDDFGTGYSSLSYLRRFPVDVLKIDQSFVRGLDQDPEAQAIAVAVINLAHALDMRATAEGVETAAQAKWLADAGCDAGQGFFFHVPMAADALAELLAGVPAGNEPRG